MDDLHKTLETLLDHKHLEPYIRHIRFPFFKNLETNLKINFEFPLTAIVGQNGTNKSSVLRALYGCPDGYSVGNFWFSTSVDPIDANEINRPRFIYAYYHSDSKSNVEAIKTRINKARNPDYWEPSRPLIRDGMAKMPPYRDGVEGRTKTRWDSIKKNVVFIDFRSEISAFDKYFYHGKLKETLSDNSKQDFIRRKSKLLKEAVDQNLSSKTMYRGQHEQIHTNVQLQESVVNFISQILGRKYTDIRIIGHRFFRTEGHTVILKSADLVYSEAFAGSGEYAVVMLVHQVCKADDKSLIILDEPEVSLHPGAQTRLINFLLNKIRTNKHQIVLGTHSPFIIENLPKQAIKTLYQDPVSKKIVATDETTSVEAFFHLEADRDKRTILVEDRLAAEVVKKSLRNLGEAIHKQFEVRFVPGGATALLNSYLPAYAETGVADTLFIMDGDQRPSDNTLFEESVNQLTFDELKELTKALLGSEPKLHADSHNGVSSENQKIEALKKIIRFAEKNLFYLPGLTPESFIWDNIEIEESLIEIEESLSNLSPKEKFEFLTKKMLGKAEYENVTGDEIFQVQKQCLASISDELLDELSEKLKASLS